jgi:uncharacterized protein
MDYVWVSALVIGAIVAWGINLVSLPGNWAAWVLVILYAWLGPSTGRLDLGWPAVIGTGLMALAGEIVEFAAAAAGAKKAGGNTRATVLAIIGSMIGAIVGATVGIPFIPVLGSLVGAVLFGALGAAAGATFGQWHAGDSIQKSATVGHAAFWGRLVGTIGKLGCGGGAIVVMIICLFLE